ncbi:MAG: histidine phosphatase family protein [Nannocystaceae bacterium]|nr:histidine phosphatase family protein [bacterium]
MLGLWSSLRTLPEGVTHRVVLMRHAEPVAQTRGRCYGKLDVGLGAAGRAQAVAAASSFSQGDLHAVISSPRVRAKQTAQILADAVDAPLHLDPRFAEIDFGAFEGRTYAEIEASHPQAYADWMRSPTTMHFPGGESFGQMKARVLEGVRALRHAYRGVAVGLVSHGGVGRIIVADALRMPDDAIFALEQSYAGVSVLDWWDQTPALRLLNWTPR